MIFPTENGILRSVFATMDGDLDKEASVFMRKCKQIASDLAKIGMSKVNIFNQMVMQANTESGEFAIRAVNIYLTRTTDSLAEYKLNLPSALVHQSLFNYIHEKSRKRFQDVVVDVMKNI